VEQRCCPIIIAKKRAVLKSTSGPRRCAGAGGQIRVNYSSSVVERTEDCDYGRSAWIRDPEGNQLELFEEL